MPQANNPIAEEIAGIVERTNPRGLILQGREGWLNISKYAEPPPPIPPEGAHVRVGIDNAGFVRSIEVTTLSPDHGAFVAPHDRDTRIMRQAVLNTATAILATNGEAISLDEVLRVAAQLEAWVTRE